MYVISSFYTFRIYSGTCNRYISYTCTFKSILIHIGPLNPIKNILELNMTIHDDRFSHYTQKISDILWDLCTKGKVMSVSIYAISLFFIHLKFWFIFSCIHSLQLTNKVTKKQSSLLLSSTQYCTLQDVFLHIYILKQ